MIPYDGTASYLHMHFMPPLKPVREEVSTTRSSDDIRGEVSNIQYTTGVRE